MATISEWEYHYFEADISFVVDGCEIGMRQTPIVYFIREFPIRGAAATIPEYARFEWPEGEGLIELHRRGQDLRIVANYYWSHRIGGADDGMEKPSLIDARAEVSVRIDDLIVAMSQFRLEALRDLREQCPSLAGNPEFAELLSLAGC